MFFLAETFGPPNGDPHKAINLVRSSLEFFKFNYRNCEVTIIGDLNFNYGNKDCTHVKSLKMLETLFEVKPLISNATRSTSNTKSIIDLCFTNVGNVCSSGVINININSQLSDHNPIFLVKKKIKLDKKLRIFKGRCYRNWSLDS